MTIALRAVLVVAAALVALWLVQGLRPVRDERAGIAAVTAKDGRTPQQHAARGYRLLGRAAAHTRSTEPELRLAQLDALTHRPDRAVARLRAVVAREPANYDAWVLLSETARTVDPAVAARARAAALKLSPPVPVGTSR
jgi:cytochrome c-type biogenesis protein CcmH/NrfG